LPPPRTSRSTSRQAVEQAVADLTTALAEGSLRELPVHRFTLDRIADAHDAVEGDAVGKVLIDLAE